MKVLVLTSPRDLGFVTRNIIDFPDTFVDLELDNRDYDIGVSYMYTKRIPKEHLSKPWFNFHPGPLPDYKGRNLCYHAIMNGEKMFGATLHYMDEAFDTGDIIEVRRFPIRESDTAFDLWVSTMSVSRNLFLEYFYRIHSGEEFKRIPNVGGHYYKKSPIPSITRLNDDLERWIRAVTFDSYYPKIDIHGVIYKVVKE